MNTVDPDFFEKNIKAGDQQRKERHFDKGDEPLVLRVDGRFQPAAPADAKPPQPIAPAGT